VQRELFDVDKKKSSYKSIFPELEKYFESKKKVEEEEPDSYDERGRRRSKRIRKKVQPDY
jgi:hypothetical protein